MIKIIQKLRVFRQLLVLMSMLAIASSSWQPILAYPVSPEQQGNDLRSNPSTASIMSARQHGDKQAPNIPWPEPGDDVLSTYAPLVYHEPSEQYYPITAAEILNRSTLKYSTGWGPFEDQVTVAGPPIDPVRLGRRVNNPNPYTCSQCGSRKSNYGNTDPWRNAHDSCGFQGHVCYATFGFYLVLPSDIVHGHTNNAPVYYQFDGNPAADFRITYWFCYGWSVTNVVDHDWTHQGDWESVTVFFNGRNNTVEPMSVNYHAHSGAQPILWQYVEKFGGTQHPVVYSGRGSHASYGHDGSYVPIYRWVPHYHNCGGAYTCVDTTGAGPQWRTWDSGFINIRSESWYGYTGIWGNYNSDDPDFSGPASPVLQHR